MYKLEGLIKIHQDTKEQNHYIIKLRPSPIHSISTYSLSEKSYNFTMDLINRVRKFVSHWYKRYLVSTELYMVEPWEKVVIHVLLTIFFILFWYFNYTIIVNGISKLRDTPPVDNLGVTSN